MDDQMISLDIRTILAQLNIDHKRFAEWEEKNYGENTEWIEWSEDSEQHAAAAQS